MDSTMEFRILGPLVAMDGDHEIALGGPRHRALLAALLVHPGDIVPAELLIDVLWGETPPKSAPEMLPVRISELRTLLRAGRAHQPDVVLTRGHGYMMAAGDHEVDALTFDHLVEGGCHGLRDDPRRAASRLREALSLWRGPPLPELADRPYARATIAKFEQLHLQALEARLAADIALGRAPDVLGELRGLVTEHPLREPFWHLLMLALYRAGQQHEALRAFRSIRDVLDAELGIEPGSALRELHAAILRQDPSVGPAGIPPIGPRTTPTNVPAACTTFVGREPELREIARMAETNRLVTISGVGGAGKSRLAIEFATRAVDAYPDGVWVAELAPLVDPLLIIPTVCAVLDIPEHPERALLSQLVTRLRPTSVLLVLDNCEHLISEVADLVSRLLDACPRLRVLCTSRERLRIPGEAVLPITGLCLRRPDTGAGDVLDSDAARLFIDRASRVQPGFAPSPSSSAAIATICRRLDGLPLALELAAARVGTWSPWQIAAGLGDQFRLLTQGSRVAQPRHRSLRAVVDWSYDLLDQDERRVFGRLGVFAGGFDMDAAASVCAERGECHDVRDTLARLIDKSLVVVDATAAPIYRYRLLETLRTYASTRLEEISGETARMRRRHVEYFLGVAEEAGLGLRGAEQPAWLDRLTVEHDNLRAALETALSECDVDTAARIAGSVYPFWDLRGHYAEGRRWLARILTAGPADPRVRAHALMGAATLAIVQGDVVEAVTACEQAARLSEAGQDHARLSHALQYLGLIRIFTEQLDEAECLLSASLRYADAADAVWERSWALLLMSVLATSRWDFALAGDLARQAETALGHGGDPEARAFIRVLLGFAGLGMEDAAGAAEHVIEALRQFSTLGGLWGLSITTVLAAFVLRALGRHRGAAGLLGVAEALRETAGTTLPPFVEAWLDDTLTELTTALGPVVLHSARMRGRALPRAAALAYALRQLAPDAGDVERRP
jgi:predicted ATPase/DNA-binding SARP family transcriptional activator